MAARGMGVSHTRTSTGAVLRAAPEAGSRQMLMDRWYRPHHQALERLANDAFVRRRAEFDALRHESHVR